MFDSISWAEYLMGLLIVCSLYYLVIAFIFYRGELLKQAGWGNKQTQINNHQRQPNIMGVSKPDKFPISKYTTLEDADQLVVIEPKINPLHGKSNEANLLEIVTDFLSEGKMMFQDIHENETDENLNKVKEFINRYPELAESKFRSALNLFVKDLIEQRLSIHITLNEVDSFWPTKKTN